MFGTLKPHTCGLGCDQKHAYATFYCGLCKSLGDHYGTLTRAMLTYDAVFLALVADGLMTTQAAPDRCRCPILPISFRPTVKPDSPAMRYASAMQILLCDQWLADRAEGGKRAAKAARPLLSTRVEVARTTLGELGISLAELDGFEQTQTRCEAIGVTDAREAAEPTRGALEIVFRRMALLPGVTERAQTDEARDALAAFGRHLGGAIYLIDALDDLEKDHKSRSFNPCLTWARRGDRLRVAWERIEATWSLLCEDLAALDELANTLPLLRHRDLVRSVVAGELRTTARAAAMKAHAYARAEHQHEREAERDRGVTGRAFAAFATVFMFLWVWLWSLPALAQKSPGSGPGTSASNSGKPAVPPPPTWIPKLPAPKPTSTGAASLPALPSEPASPTETPTEGTPAPPGNSPPTTDPGGTPGSSEPTGGSSTPSGGSGSGKGCSNPCSGCSNPCSGCSNPCSGCSNPCSGCDCGSCLKCDSCCKCDDCCKSTDCCKCNGGCCK